MTTVEELKRKKLEQMMMAQQQSAQMQAENEAQLAQQIEMLEMAVKQLLTKEALQRYGNLKSAHPEKAVQLLVGIGQLMQTHNIKQITDEQLKQLLMQITPEKKEFKIIRK